MAIPAGTNDLKIYRRHASYCTRYSETKPRPDTYRPTTKKEQKTDTCACPIWCRGYLGKETKIVKGSWTRATGRPPRKKLHASMSVARFRPAEPHSCQPTTARSRCGTPGNDTSVLAKMDR